MHPRPPTNQTMGQGRAMAARLIAFGVLLCFGVLMAASGPHLVHHLADVHPGHSHPHTRHAQPTDCLVLSLIQHVPLAGEFFATLPAFLPTAERACCGQPLQVIPAPRPTFQARSPPVVAPSPAEIPDA
jgi:hypothetical protein